MKATFLPGYHQNSSVASHALDHVMYSCARVQEFLQNHCGDKREDTLFSLLHICYGHLVSAGFEHSVSGGSLMSLIIYIAKIIYEVLC